MYEYSYTLCKIYKCSHTIYKMYKYGYTTEVLLVYPVLLAVAVWCRGWRW